MNKYLYRLQKQSAINDKNHARLEPVRSLKENWSLRFITGSNDNPSHHGLLEQLNKSDDYEVISLENFLPDRKLIKPFIDNLTFPYDTQLLTYSFGNHLGNIYFIWKVQEEIKSKETSTVHHILTKLPQFSTRAMRREFLNRYSQCSDKSLLRDMYRFITNDASAGESSDEAAVDNRVIGFLAESDDADLVYDLRHNNGRVANDKFDVFWEELQKKLDEKTVVDERRTKTTMYMPDWISVRDLIDDVTNNCPEGTDIPSESMVRFQFHPTNPYLNTASKYTGKYNVKYMVQQRLLHTRHIDSKYCYNQWLLLKNFASEWKEYSSLLSVDDKAIVPVGEPEQPVSSNVRRLNRSLVCQDQLLVSLDHDYHTAGIVPSVMLKIDIPSDVNESFHRGQLHVSVKDKYFQPSTAMRHSTEVMSFLRGDTGEVEIDSTAGYTNPHGVFRWWSRSQHHIHECKVGSTSIVHWVKFRFLHRNKMCAIPIIYESS